MEKALSLTDTTIGKKALMALTGLVMFGFLIGHMAGNLQVFLGPEVLNEYAATLKGMPPVLWGTRTVLFVSVVTHIILTAQLYGRSMAARSKGYKVKKNAVTSYAAVTMKLSGPILALYIVFHLAHFTAPGLALSGGYEHSHTDVYNNVVQAFSIPWAAAVYIVANILVGIHVYHGAWSLFQSLGLSHPRHDGKRDFAAKTLAIVLTIGNISMPIAVLAGVVKAVPVS